MKLMHSTWTTAPELSKSPGGTDFIPIQERIPQEEGREAAKHASEGTSRGRNVVSETLTSLLY